MQQRQDMPCDGPVRNGRPKRSQGAKWEQSRGAVKTDRYQTTRDAPKSAPRFDRGLSFRWIQTNTPFCFEKLLFATQLSRPAIQAGTAPLGCFLLLTLLSPRLEKLWAPILQFFLPRLTWTGSTPT